MDAKVQDDQLHFIELCNAIGLLVVSATSFLKEAAPTEKHHVIRKHVSL